MPAYWNYSNGKIVIPIFIPKETDVVGVLFSGGADSTLLANLLTRQFKNKFVFVTLDKNGAPEIARRLISMLPPGDYDHLIVEIPESLPPPKWSKHATEVAVSERHIDLCYSGSNRQPDVGVLGDDADDLLKIQRPRRISPEHIEKDFAYIPFLELTKDEIIRAYYTEGIEHLLPLTKSCIQSQDEHNCGKCWYCRERIWAFNQIGKPPVM